ncbi:MAG: S41 family peptidase [bacterium]
MKDRGIFFKIFILTIIIFSGFFVSTQMYGETETSKSSSTISQLYLFNTILSYLKSGYVKEIDTQILIEGAIRGMLSKLDPHTIYLDPDEYSELKIDTVGKFGGLGIEITITPEDNTLTVIAPIEGTPAYYSGIKARDKIIEIDGKSTEGITLTQAVNRMRGAPGTNCKLKIRRLGEEDEMEFIVTRAIIDVKSIPFAFILDDGIGYIRLTGFSEDSGKELLSKLRDLKSKGMEGLILDIRGNPGGLLDLAVDISSIFLPEKKLIVYTQSERKKKKEKEFTSIGGIHLGNGKIDKSEFIDIPLVVLVDDASASGSEIVAGAIQDHRRGKILGMKTFGKASVQTIIPLDIEGFEKPAALKMTVAYYYTPNGTLINEKGISPDIELKYPDYPALINKMAYKGLFRIYAEKLYAKEKVNALKSFESNANLLSDIVYFIKEQNFHFYPEYVEKTLPNSGEEYMLAELEKDKDTVIMLIKRELLRLVEGEESAYRFMIDRDDWVKRAIEELKSSISK